ncbi:hypothetical protein VDGL01_04188 [Verticillium dahliae]
MTSTPSPSPTSDAMRHDCDTPSDNGLSNVATRRSRPRPDEPCSFLATLATKVAGGEPHSLCILVQRLSPKASTTAILTNSFAPQSHPDVVGLHSEASTRSSSLPSLPPPMAMPTAAVDMTWWRPRNIGKGGHVNAHGILGKQLIDVSQKDGAQQKVDLAQTLAICPSSVWQQPPSAVLDSGSASVSAEASSVCHTQR